MIRLRVLDGPNQGATLEVDEDEVIIGSDPERCSVLLVDRAVRPVHVTIRRVSDEEMTLETADDAPVSLDGQAVPPGLYASGAVVLLAIGRNEILVQCRAVAPPAPGPQQDDVPDTPHLDGLPPQAATGRPSRTPSWKMAALFLVVVAALSLGFFRLIQPPEAGGTGERAAAPPEAAAPSPAPSAAHSTPPAAGPKPPVAPPAADERVLSYDPNPATQAAQVTRLDAGTVLFEPQTPAPSTPKVSQRVLRRFVDDRDGLIVETTAGERFMLKSDRRDGYGMRWLSDEEIELHRGTETLHIKVE